MLFKKVELYSNAEKEQLVHPLLIPHNAPTQQILRRLRKRRKALRIPTSWIQTLGAEKR